MTNLRYPYRFDEQGHSAGASEEEWIRGLVEQVLFTSPGERVMRPDFGSGLMQLVFAPNSPELASTVELLAQGALQQWLGHLIALEALEVEAVDSTLRVRVRYSIRRTQELRDEAFVREAG
ncbi:MAG: GPW/gp25 family protein [Actinomycetota bacterium]